MIKSLNTAATGMAAQQTNMDTISNNIANVSTNGFKKSRAEFEDLMYHTEKEPGAATGLNSYSPNGVQTGLGVRTSSIKKDFTEGNSTITKRSLDIQIEGAGFFQVSTPDGGVGYTRDGAFSKDANGKIVDRNGNSLLPEITIPPGATGLEISANGSVAITMPGNDIPQNIGQIDIANFVNPAGLKAMGKNVFTQTGASGNPIVGTPGQSSLGSLAQGSLETSNVNIVEEMVNMITTQRAYETNSKVVQTVDQMLSTINNIR